MCVVLKNLNYITAAMFPYTDEENAWVSRLVKVKIQDLKEV
tara:strand:+ start:820 stop:942 length:123 start_codon:yes stop_codon:yes gene_type:complete